MPFCPTIVSINTTQHVYAIKNDDIERAQPKHTPQQKDILHETKTQQARHFDIVFARRAPPIMSRFRKPQPKRKHINENHKCSVVRLLASLPSLLRALASSLCCASICTCTVPVPALLLCVSARSTTPTPTHSQSSLPHPPPAHASGAGSVTPASSSVSIPICREIDSRHRGERASDPPQERIPAPLSRYQETHNT